MFTIPGSLPSGRFRATGAAATFPSSSPARPSSTGSFAGGVSTMFAAFGRPGENLGFGYRCLTRSRLQEVLGSQPREDADPAKDGGIVRFRVEAFSAAENLGSSV